MAAHRHCGAEPAAREFRPACTSDVTIRSSILSSNTIGATIANCGILNGDSAVTDLGYNLEGPVGAATCPFSAANHDLLGVDPPLGPRGSYGGPTVGATGFALGTSLAAQPTYTERLLPGSPAIDQIPAGSCLDTSGTPLTTDQRGAGFVRPFVTLCDTGAFEASVFTFGGPFGTSGSCSAAITFFSGGTAFALRPGSAPNTLMSYLAIKGHAGQITAVPLVPRAGVPSTLVCTVPNPAAVPSPSTATTVTVDAQVVRSTNPSVAQLILVRVVATRTLSTETVTVSAINPADNSTGATLYTLTPSVQPQSFVVRVGIFPLFQFATPK